MLLRYNLASTSETLSDDLVAKILGAGQGTYGQHRRADTALHS